MQGWSCLVYVRVQVGVEPHVQEALYPTLLQGSNDSVRMCLHSCRAYLVDVIECPFLFTSLQLFSEQLALDFIGRKIRAKRTLFKRNFKTAAVCGFLHVYFWLWSRAIIMRV